MLDDENAVGRRLCTIYGSHDRIVSVRHRCRNLNRDLIEGRIIAQDFAEHRDSSTTEGDADWLLSRRRYYRRFLAGRHNGIGRPKARAPELDYVAWSRRNCRQSGESLVLAAAMLSSTYVATG